MRALSFSSLVFGFVFVSVVAGAACDPLPPPPVVGSSTRDDDDEGEEADTGCDTDEDCRGGEVCDDGACARVCDEDADCAGGQLCADARCRTPECIVDVDCPGGFFCDANRCAGITACDDGDRRCVDGAAARCIDGREELETCPRGTACDSGACVDVVPPAEGEAEGEGEGEVPPVAEGEGEFPVEGEGESGEPCIESCVDDDTVVSCLFGFPFEQDCGTGQRCEGNACVDDVAACQPRCGDRACGPDPVCGESCGSCTDRCSVDGQCETPTPAGTARIEVAITPPDAGFDLYLSRASSGSFCDVDDSCFAENCQAGSELRPDWDSNANSVEGDPLSTSGSGDESIAVLTPRTAQTYRIAIHNQRDATPATVTVNVVVDGVNTFGASKRLNSGELWTGISARWSGTAVTVTRTDAVQANFSCGGETCSAGGGECGAGFVCDGSACRQCIDSGDCGAGDECRESFCVDDTSDRAAGGVCGNAVDCRDDLVCSNDGLCGEPCEAFLCFLSPDSCCTTTGGTCGFDGVCGF